MPEREVVEALAAALGGEAEDVGEETDAELLVVAGVGLDEALLHGRLGRRRKVRKRGVKKGRTQA